MIDGSNIQCVVTEEEMQRYGLRVEDIFSNTEKAQDFLNEILDMAEEEMGCPMGDGTKTVQAVCIPGNALVLTFSDKKEIATEESGIEEFTGILYFNTLSECIAFGKKVEWGRYDDAALYKDQNRLVLIVDLKDADMREVDWFFAAAFEFAQSVEENSWKAAFLREHAKTIIPEHALQVLVNL
ncbi:MAG: adaptor protein MecA [Lachnospiraceae bacterium]|nr:adaptor protein MecA [Lachnospiraceae bacterium]MDY4838297.1 adaptor protein MecA [Lachnospiraceae bacterium]